MSKIPNTPEWNALTLTYTVCSIPKKYSDRITVTIEFAPENNSDFHNFGNTYYVIYENHKTDDFQIVYSKKYNLTNLGIFPSMDDCGKFIWNHINENE